MGDDIGTNIKSRLDRTTEAENSRVGKCLRGIVLLCISKLYKYLFVCYIEGMIPHFPEEDYWSEMGVYDEATLSIHDDLAGSGRLD
jgi:hypothetical protein